MTTSQQLWNEDLAPTSEAQRTWRWYHFAALWVGMVMCIPAYTLSASLVEAGMSGWQAVLTVFLANAIVLGVQDRVREHAVLQTLGFRSGLIARLIVTEGLLMGVLGGGLGTVAAAAAVRFGGFSLSTVGLSINVSADAGLVAIGLVMSGAVGVIAGIVPAIQASRREIAQCFRAV